MLLELNDNLQFLVESVFSKGKYRNICDFSIILTMQRKGKLRNIGEFPAILFFSTRNAQLQCKNVFVRRTCWKKNG